MIDLRCQLGRHAFEWLPHPAPIAGVVAQNRQERCRRGCFTRRVRVCLASEHQRDRHPEGDDAARASHTRGPGRDIPDGYVEVPVEDVDPSSGTVRLVTAPAEEAPVIIQTLYPVEPGSVRAFVAAPLTRVELGIDCATCGVSMRRDQWPRHYRTREHRAAIRRQNARAGRGSPSEGPPWQSRPGPGG